LNHKRGFKNQTELIISHSYTYQIEHNIFSFNQTKYVVGMDKIYWIFDISSKSQAEILCQCSTKICILRINRQRSACVLFMTNRMLYLQRRRLITLYLFVKKILLLVSNPRFGISKNSCITTYKNTGLSKRKLLANHNPCIFRLTRKMMTYIYLLYIG
jgi:hypothetical protein